MLQFMNNHYVACDLGAECGRIVLGTLCNNELSIGEAHHFPNTPVEEDGSLHWNIPQLYLETIEGLKVIGGYEENIESISCHSWGADYLLFGSDGALITPTFHHGDRRSADGMKKVYSKVPLETVYEETGVQQMSTNTLFQLGAEKWLRLRRASHLLPVADAFNYLLAGVPRVEMSLASTMQLFNPVTKAWSERLLDAVGVPAKLLPPLVHAGTRIGQLRPEVGQQTGLGEVSIVASCSHEVAAALVALPIHPGETWAYFEPGSVATNGTELPIPLINEASRTLNFTNEAGYGGTTHLYKPVPGLWILDECVRFWQENQREMDIDLLMHLTGPINPFECLIDPTDPRFIEPGDMPLKIQAYCKETDQPVPRKPGAIVRCILESLALSYRKTLREIEAFTDSKISRLYVLPGKSNIMLNHFTANALNVPAILASPNAAAIGNVMVQALALGHIQTLEEAREIVRRSVKLEAIIPHATPWDAAYERFLALSDVPTQ
jgi:rhamnulokinase